MAEYSEHEVPEGNTQNDILTTLAGAGNPFLFITAHSEGEGLGVSVETGGGIRDVEMVRKLLNLTLDALP